MLLHDLAALTPGQQVFHVSCHMLQVQTCVQVTQLDFQNRSVLQCLEQPDELLKGQFLRPYSRFQPCCFYGMRNLGLVTGRL